MSLQDKIEALRSLADQIIPTLEREKEVMLSKAAQVRAIIQRCKIKQNELNLSLQPFAQEMIQHPEAVIVVSYAWRSSIDGLFIDQDAPDYSPYTNHWLEPKDLPAIFVPKAIAGLEVFVDYYTKLVERKLAALASGSAPEGAR